MTLIATPSFSRRNIVIGGLAAATGLLVPGLGGAQQQRLPTPAQTEGPFYPTAFPADVDNDLVILRGSDARAGGTVAHIRGRVLDLDGEPLADARLEIWQCDANGRYLHPGSGGSAPRDSAFQGYGRAVSAADGAYSFRTIKPVPYSGRTPHIHFAVASGTRKLVTQMYVAGEPRNASDGPYNSITDRRQRELITVRLEAAEGIEAGALAGTFDIVLAA